MKRLGLRTGLRTGRDLGRHQDKKPPMQFSKKQCLYADVLVLIVLGMDFALKWNGKEGMSDVAIAVVSMFGGFVTAGYFALSGVRDVSVNKIEEKIVEMGGTENEDQLEN